MDLVTTVADFNTTTENIHPAEVTQAGWHEIFSSHYITTPSFQETYTSDTTSIPGTLSDYQDSKTTKFYKLVFAFSGSNATSAQSYIPLSLKDGWPMLTFNPL